MSKQPDNGREAWSRYWRQGALHSCSNAYSGNYEKAIRQFWLDFFGTLKDGARVLDVGTGNGAVAYLAREAAQLTGRHFHIEGIDAADIRPDEAAARLGLSVGDIVFRGGISSERTGYPADHFDAVSSQYAIEYSSVPDTLGELARVIKPGGRAAFLVHHADSEVVTVTRRELKAFDFLRHEAPLLLASRRYLAALASARDMAQLSALLKEREARRRRKEVEKQYRRVIAFARAPARGAAFLEGIALRVAETLRDMARTGPRPASNRLDLLEQEMDAHQQRLRAIVRAAMNAGGVEAFCHQAQAAGFRTDSPGTISGHGADLVGWTVTAVLRPG